MARRYVGIDLATKTMEVCILDGKKIERHGLTTDRKGREILRMLLRKSDVVGMEVCCYWQLLSRELIKGVGCKVYDLNAGDLRIIWKSRKKTDKEDALKIAKYIRDTPEEEMVTVPLPSEEEEAYRSEISAKEFLKKERNQAINRLHSLYARSGIVDVTKKDLKDKEGREARRGELPEVQRLQAEMLEEQLELFERQLKEMKEKVDEKTRAHELTPYLMSIPGMGLGIASVILAYIGDGSRFSKASQVANYAGLVPRVDCSGETERYGSIARYTYCKAIRGVIIEGIWAMAKSQNGGWLLQKYNSLNERMGKKKSAVAVARKMVTLAWLLIRRREFYRGTTKLALEKKLRYYKVRPEKWESLLDNVS